jgi:hypothetical protein
VVSCHPFSQMRKRRRCSSEQLTAAQALKCSPQMPKPFGLRI